MSRRKRQTYGTAIYFGLTFLAGSYFLFASVQGEYGLFRRIQIEAEADDLRATRDELMAQLDVMRNKTHRLSDDFLDLDLLDEQARSVLGMARPDEIILR